MTAKKRYDALTVYRSEYLHQADIAARLTLPYLIHDVDDQQRGGVRDVKTPWQSVGSKGVVTLASKLMLALMPVNTSFFKLQLDELTELLGEQNLELRLDDTTVESLANEAYEPEYGARPLRRII